MNPVTALLRALIVAYRWTLSPVLGTNCRFTPTCSQYALDALATHGAVRGLWLAARRLGRCHPWGGWGYDPVPGPVPEPFAGRKSPRAGDKSGTLP